MRKFEIGNQYSGSGARIYEITKRTAKTVTYKEIDHAGRYNERIVEEKTVKVHLWDSREVIFPHNDTIEA